MQKRTLILAHDVARQRAIEAVRSAPAGFVVTIQEPNRSALQNAFYWAVIGEISEQVEPDGKHFGSDTWHEYFKGQFLEPEVLDLPGGRCKFIEPTTTKLGKRAFSDYMEQILSWASSQGVLFCDKTRCDERAWRDAA